MNASAFDNIEAAVGGAAETEYQKTEKNPTPAISRLEKGVEAPAVSDEDYEVPTEHDLATLRRVPAKVPWASYLVAFCELTERLSYYGTTVVFQNFVSEPLPPGSRTGAGDQAGALGLGQQAGTATNTFNTFWIYVMPLLGAYIADTYLGRFRTVCLAVLIATIGHVLLVASAAPAVITSDPKGAYGAFWIAIIVMGVGTGAFKSTVGPLIADQIKGERQAVVSTPKGERVIVDPALTTARLFMYFYLFINIGAIIGQISITYTEKYVGYWAAFLIPTLVFLICAPVLFFGRKLYRRVPPEGNVLAKFVRLLRFCARGTFSWNPVRFWRNLTANDFWARGKPSNVEVSQRPSWMTYDDAWVDEARRGVKACQVFVLYPFYWIAYNQISNNLVSQAVNLKKNGVPNEIVSNLDPLSLIILIPLFDQFVYPGLRRLRINFSPIKRITAGFWCAALAMVAAAVIQQKIYEMSPCGHDASNCEVDLDGPNNGGFTAGEVNINVWAQSVPYVLVGLSEVFASVTGLEYAYTKAPKNARSIVMACFLVSNAFGAAIQYALLPITTDPYLTWQYVASCLIAAVAGTAFWFIFRKLDAEEDTLNNLSTGHTKADVTPDTSDRASSSHEKESA